MLRTKAMLQVHDEENVVHFFYKILNSDHCLYYSMESIMESIRGCMISPLKSQIKEKNSG